MCRGLPSHLILLRLSKNGYSMKIRLQQVTINVYHPVRNSFTLCLGRVHRRDFFETYKGDAKKDRKINEELL